MPQILRGSIYRVIDEHDNIIGEYDNQDEAQGHLDELNSGIKHEKIDTTIRICKALTEDLGPRNDLDKINSFIRGMRLELTILEKLCTDLS